MKILLSFLFLFSESGEKLKNLFSSGKIEPKPKIFSSLENGALGLQDLGEVSNVVTNWGVLTTSPMFITPSLHWPKSAPFQHQYSYGTHFFVATKDNVITIHNRNDETNSDWYPLRTHSGEVELAGGWPMMATSDDPRTWPEGFWPGPFRIDPNTGQEVEGEFVSDRDHYCEYDDSQNPKGSMGIKISQITYCYGRYYAEDILIFRLLIENTSDSVIHNLYTGFWTAIWVDFDEADLLDFVHIYDTLNPKKNFVYYWDADGIPDDPWVSVGYMGFGVLTTPYNMGITDFHYWEKSFEPYTDEVLWPIISSDTSDPDIVPSRYFHSDTNIHIDDTPPEEGPGIYRVLLATGPFDLPPGDTVEFALFSCAGNDTSELFENARTVFRMKENYYQGPSAPPPPQVRVVPGNREVLLYWDPFPSETTPDPFTGQYDFEGYKIYRSEDGGITWGTPITNEKGEVVGYVPIAIFDLIDGIKGPDPANPYQSLGEDSGLKYEFRDTGLINGKEYVYAVTAYDKGNQNPDSLIPSLESYKKAISVIPTPSPSDLLPGSFSDTILSPLNGLCDAQVKIIPLDVYSLKDNTYRIYVKTDTQKYITLVDLTEGDTLLKDYEVPDTSIPFAFPETDGFRLYVKDEEEGFKETHWEEVKGDTSDFEWFTDARSTHGEAKRRGYDIFYIEIDTTAQSMAQVLRPLSLQQYNTYVPVDTPPYPLPLKAYVHPHIYKDTLIPVDKYFLLEPRFVHPNPPPGYFSEFGWDLIPGGKAWVELEANRYLYPDELGFLYYYRDSTGAIYDSSLVFVRTLNGPDTATPPSQGDIFKIELKKPLWDGLIYEFTSISPQKTPPSFDPLSKVKVVPNPYIKGKTRLGEEKIIFLNVPQKAKIKIFTLYGEPVITLRSQGTGSVYWNLRNKDGVEVAYGLYIYVIESEGRKKIGKFAVIK